MLFRAFPQSKFVHPLPVYLTTPNPIVHIPWGSKSSRCGPFEAEHLKEVPKLLSKPLKRFRPYPSLTAEFLTENLSLQFTPEYISQQRKDIFSMSYTSCFKVLRKNRESLWIFVGCFDMWSQASRTHYITSSRNCMKRKSAVDSLGRPSPFHLLFFWR